MCTRSFYDLAWKLRHVMDDLDLGRHNYDEAESYAKV